MTSTAAGDRGFQYMGAGTSCRLDVSDTTQTGNGTVEMATFTTSLDDCKDLCVGLRYKCTGVEYVEGVSTCGVWTQPIGHVERQEGRGNASHCLVYTGPVMELPVTKRVFTVFTMPTIDGQSLLESGTAGVAGLRAAVAEEIKDIVVAELNRPTIITSDLEVELAPGSLVAGTRIYVPEDDSEIDVLDILATKQLVLEERVAGRLSGVEGLDAFMGPHGSGLAVRCARATYNVTPAVLVSGTVRIKAPRGNVHQQGGPVFRGIEEMLVAALHVPHNAHLEMRDVVDENSGPDEFALQYTFTMRESEQVARMLRNISAMDEDYMSELLRNDLRSEGVGDADGFEVVSVSAFDVSNNARVERTFADIIGTTPDAPSDGIPIGAGLLGVAALCFVCGLLFFCAGVICAARARRGNPSGKPEAKTKVYVDLGDAVDDIAAGPFRVVPQVDESGQSHDATWRAIRFFLNALGQDQPHQQACAPRALMQDPPHQQARAPQALVQEGGPYRGAVCSKVLDLCDPMGSCLCDLAAGAHEHDHDRDKTQHAIDYFLTSVEKLEQSTPDAVRDDRAPARLGQDPCHASALSPEAVPGVGEDPWLDDPDDDDELLHGRAPGSATTRRSESTRGASASRRWLQVTAPPPPTMVRPREPPADERLPDDPPPAPAMPEAPPPPDLADIDAAPVHREESLACHRAIDAFLRVTGPPGRGTAAHISSFGDS